MRELGEQIAGVHVTGTVDEMRDYIRPARAFVCPLRFGSGIKNKILAAMAVGRPVIATPISLDGIDAKPDHDVLVAETPAQFAQQVVRVIQDDDLARRIAENGRRMVLDKYSWSTKAEVLEVEMHAALREHNPS